MPDKHVESRLRNFGRRPVSLPRFLRRHAVPAAIVAGWNAVHRFYSYPDRYLTRFDPEIWIAQLLSWTKIAVETAVLFVAVAFAAEVLSRGIRRMRPGRSGGRAADRTPARGRTRALLAVSGLAIVVSPIVACWFAGGRRASLWLDEVFYWYMEQFPALRATEWSRPGSKMARWFPVYLYSDIQRGVHRLFDLAGFHLRTAPELYLRALSILSVLAAAVFIFVRVWRSSGRWPWAVVSALGFSASPLMLFYAFEARVYAFAALVVVVDFWLWSRILEGGAGRRRLAAAILLAIFAVHLHSWVVCLFLGVGLAGAVYVAYTRDRSAAKLLAWCVLPPAIVGIGETAAVLFTGPRTEYGFPLFRPTAFEVFLQGTIRGPFALFPPPSWFQLGSISLPVLIVAVVMIGVVFDSLRSPLVVLPLGSFLGLLVSVEVGARVGFFVVPRYQVPLVAALLAAFAICAKSLPVKSSVVVLVLFELASIPALTVPDIVGKGNAREIASVVQSDTPRAGTAVVVQHGLRLGYPDPLQSFPLQFYLDELRPEASAIPILELPSLTDVTGSRSLQKYFMGGNPEKLRYAATPIEQWRAWLASSPFDRLWFVSPEPRIALEARQRDQFAATIASSGFSEDRRLSREVGGYPPTVLRLYRRGGAVVGSGSESHGDLSTPPRDPLVFAR